MVSFYVFSTDSNVYMIISVSNVSNLLLCCFYPNLLCLFLIYFSPILFSMLNVFNLILCFLPKPSPSRMIHVCLLFFTAICNNLLLLDYHLLMDMHVKWQTLFFYFQFWLLEVSCKKNSSELLYHFNHLLLIFYLAYVFNICSLLFFFKSGCLVSAFKL